MTARFLHPTRIQVIKGSLLKKTNIKREFLRNGAEFFVLIRSIDIYDDGFSTDHLNLYLVEPAPQQRWDRKERADTCYTFFASNKNSIVLTF
ncbi:hypothetical protein JTE90_011431 [Oedothorax gibbosus]|uniref:Uncharacterized protein n=1 Tax=Oedothorax gibbosus TaxID=931172 RepID=A0AAV6VDY0_9ARAC|nr:hypothetical protein JTE90_011431 [Oedothorax gibbosus]